MKSNRAWDWFPFYHDDWLTSVPVSAVSLAAQGALVRFLCHAYKVKDGGFLHYRGYRADKAGVAKILGCPVKIVDELVDEGCLAEIEGALMSVRAAVEIEVQLGKAEFYQRRASAGGEAKARKERKGASSMLQAPPKQPSSTSKATFKHASSLLLTETETETIDHSPKGAPVAKATQPPRDRLEIQQVFGHWQELWGHPDAKLTAQRETKIRHALQAYGLEYCLRALDGWRSDDWAERHARLDRHDLTVVFRDLGKVEQGMAKGQEAKVARPNGFAVPTRAQLLPLASQDEPAVKTQEQLDDEEEDALPEDQWRELQAPPYYGDLRAWKADRAAKEVAK